MSYQHLANGQDTPKKKRFFEILEHQPVDEALNTLLEQQAETYKRARDRWTGKDRTSFAYTVNLGANEMIVAIDEELMIRVSNFNQRLHASMNAEAGLGDERVPVTDDNIDRELAAVLREVGIDENDDRLPGAREAILHARGQLTQSRREDFIRQEEAAEGQLKIVTVIRRFDSLSTRIQMRSAMTKLRDLLTGAEAQTDHPVPRSMAFTKPQATQFVNGAILILSNEGPKHTKVSLQQWPAVRAYIERLLSDNHSGIDQERVLEEQGFPLLANVLRYFSMSKEPTGGTPSPAFELFKSCLVAKTLEALCEQVRLIAENTDEGQEAYHIISREVQRMPIAEQSGRISNEDILAVCVEYLKAVANRRLPGKYKHHRTFGKMVEEHMDFIDVYGEWARVCSAGVLPLIPPGMRTKKYFGGLTKSRTKFALGMLNDMCGQNIRDVLAPIGECLVEPITQARRLPEIQWGPLVNIDSSVEDFRDAIVRAFAQRE